MRFARKLLVSVVLALATIFGVYALAVGVEWVVEAGGVVGAFGLLVLVFTGFFMMELA